MSDASYSTNPAVRQVRAFNAVYDIGAPVLHRGKDGALTRTVTRTPATVIGYKDQRRAVIWLDGFATCVALATVVALATEVA